jgi:hypothetical protein
MGKAGDLFFAFLCLHRMGLFIQNCTVSRNSNFGPNSRPGLKPLQGLSKPDVRVIIGSAC